MGISEIKREKKKKFKKDSHCWNTTTLAKKQRMRKNNNAPKAEGALVYLTARKQHYLQRKTNIAILCDAAS